MTIDTVIDTETDPDVEEEEEIDVEEVIRASQQQENLRSSGNYPNASGEKTKKTPEPEPEPEPTTEEFIRQQQEQEKARKQHTYPKTNKERTKPNPSDADGTQTQPSRPRPQRKTRSQPEPSRPPSAAPSPSTTPSSQPAPAAAPPSTPPPRVRKPKESTGEFHKNVRVPGVKHESPAAPWSDNYFEILGLDPSKEINNKDVKTAYRNAARHYHPDKNQDQAELYTEYFQKLDQAKEKLGSEHSRRQYMNELSSGGGRPQQSSSQPSRPPPPPSRPPPHERAYHEQQERSSSGSSYGRAPPTSNPYTRTHQAPRIPRFQADPETAHVLPERLYTPRDREMMHQYPPKPADWSSTTRNLMHARSLHPIKRKEVLVAEADIRRREFYDTYTHYRVFSKNNYDRAKNILEQQFREGYQVLRNEWSLLNQEQPAFGFDNEEANHLLRWELDFKKLINDLADIQYTENLRRQREEATRTSQSSQSSAHVYYNGGPRRNWSR